MANLYEFAQANLTSTTDTIVYTVPANTTAVITNATVANTLGVARLVTVSIVRGTSVPPVSVNEVVINTPVQLTDDTHIESLIGQHLGELDTVWFRLDDVGSVNAFLAIREFV